MIKSDHILNLLDEVDGKLPDDKNRIVGMLQSFINMDPEKQCTYQIGRRLGIFHRIEDLENYVLRSKAEGVRRQMGITPENADKMIEEFMKRFI